MTEGPEEILRNNMACLMSKEFRKEVGSEKEVLVLLQGSEKAWWERYSLTWALQDGHTVGNTRGKQKAW